MEINFTITDAIYDCSIIIEDSCGKQNHILGSERSKVSVFVSGEDFTLTLVPLMPNYKDALNDAGFATFKEMLAGKAAGFMISAFDNMLLRVGCTYRITGAQDGDIIILSQTQYAFTTFDKLDLFDFMPVAYMFFEASCGGQRFPLSGAFETNRKTVLSSARKLALLDFGLGLIITYPIKVSRVKRLTSKRKIANTLKKFNKMSEEKREELLRKQEKFFS
jgi:hypothetical protein